MMDSVQVTDDKGCFICGEENPIGLKIRPERDAETKSATMELTVSDLYQGWKGVVHGGMIAALLDEVSAYAALTVSKQIVTAELNIRYLKPVPVGSGIRVSAVVREQVRRSLFVDAQLEANGEILARAEARMVILKSVYPSPSEQTEIP